MTHLEILPMVLGAVSTNCYLVADPSTDEAVVIDPAWDGQLILEEANKRGWNIGQLWYTHAHFDHFGGAAEFCAASTNLPGIALHPLDLDLWMNQGGAPYFGLTLECGPRPDLELTHGQILRVGGESLKVFHTPGHTPGHCVFYSNKENVLFSGDLIFKAEVGRTDLPGGDWETLVESIRTHVFTLPAETRILPGHGESTSVGDEQCSNPLVGY